MKNIRHKTYNQVYIQAKEPVETHVWAEFRKPVWSQVWDQVYDQVLDQVWSHVWNCTGSKIK